MIEDLSLIDDVLNNKLDKDISVYNNNFLSCFSDELKEVFLEDGVTEIMINGTRDIFVEKNSEIFNLPFKVTELEIQRFIDTVSQLNSRNVDFNHPIFDGKLPGGLRCNVVTSPVSLDGVIITIRKHIQSINNFDVLIENGMLDKSQAELLINAVRERLNIIIAGGTGTGKTTLVNVLFNSLGNIKSRDERIITIEDTAELRLKLPHVIRLESRYPTPDCPSEVTIRDLVKTALRMRPDRIIIGEVRGEEAYDFLHALNTGHRGTVCTIHANSCRDSLRRLETLSILGHSNLDISIPRNWIASNIHMIVYIERVNDKRKIMEIKKIEGIECGNYVLHDLI